MKGAQIAIFALFLMCASSYAAVNYNAAAESTWAELKQLRRASQVLRLEERFPMQERIPNLKYSVEEFAGRDALTMSRFEIDSKKWEGELQTINFSIWLEGTEKDRPRIEAWVRSWPGRHLRWIEPRDANLANSLEYVKNEGFRIKARAFRLQEHSESQLSGRVDQEREKLSFYWSKVFPGQTFSSESVISSIASSAKVSGRSTQSASSTRVD